MCGGKTPRFLILDVFPQLRDTLTRGFLIICSWKIR
jgi:hypothetical protein